MKTLKKLEAEKETKEFEIENQNLKDRLCDKDIDDLEKDI